MCCLFTTLFMWVCCWHWLSMHLWDAVERGGRTNQMWPSSLGSSDLKQETRQRQINEPMYKCSHSVHLTRCSDVFIRPQGLVGSFWREVSEDLKRLRKLTHCLGREANPDIRNYISGSPDWGQKMHLTRGKRFGIENWAVVGQQKKKKRLNCLRKLLWGDFSA